MIMESGSVMSPRYRMGVMICSGIGTLQKNSGKAMMTAIVGGLRIIFSGLIRFRSPVIANTPSVHVIALKAMLYTTV